MAVRGVKKIFKLKDQIRTLTAQEPKWGEGEERERFALEIIGGIPFCVHFDQFIMLFCHHVF